MRIRVIFTLFVIFFAFDTQAAVVKKSNSGICHDEQSPHYHRTSRFKAFDSLDLCLASGGRLPANRRNAVIESSTYQRNAFQHWIDENNNCLNTRHELLKSQSTGPVTMHDDGCRVLRGRWNDPYSGQVFFDSSQVDVDHLIPLRWAWEHGASNWNSDKRKTFANDERNLFIVSASLNRSKGAKGPSEWLPPNEAFHCQYVTRYLRILIIYDFNESVRGPLRELRSSLC